MTLEEACMYMGISPDDDDIDLGQLERNYNTKKSIYDLKRFNPETPEYREAKRIRANIEEAYEYLLDVYKQLHEDDDAGTKRREDQFMKLAVIMAGIFLLCFGGVVYYVLNMRTPETAQKVEVVREIRNDDYEKLRRDIEQLKAKAITPQTPQNNISDYSELVERLQTGMVYIEVDRSSSKSRGSGFLVSSNGDILTNYHVIKDARRITVSPYDSIPVEAFVKDFDSDKDIALIQAKTINDNSLPRAILEPYLHLSSTQPKQGERIIAIGNPKGFQGTVSDGVVSAYRKDDSGNLWMQFTAPVSPGSSGGALFNLKGEVVGMPTYVWTEGQNLNFAIPSTVLKEFLASAINKPVRQILLPIKPVKTPQTTKSSKGSGIPLPDAKGFLVHKWGCSVESIKKYVASPLQSISYGFYSTHKKFKAFKSRLDTEVWYHFQNNKLDSITFIIESTRDNSISIEIDITRELTELYHQSPHIEYKTYDKVGTIWECTWYPTKLAVQLNRNIGGSTIFIDFRPR